MSRTPSKETAAPPKPTAKLPPTRRLRAIRHGNNDYELVEDTYDCPPTSTRTLKRSAKEIVADEARIWLVEYVGPNRTGDTGL